MAILHKPTKHARFFEPDPLDLCPDGAEQEHKDSCDINKMIKNVQRGLEIRGSGPQQYGYDDTTMDALTLRIQKQQLEEELKKAQSIEFTEEELKAIPDKVKQKFKFKTKAKNESKKNDDQTTNKSNSKLPDVSQQTAAQHQTNARNHQPDDATQTTP